MKGLLFTYLLTYGGAVASIFNPFVGLLIYICFAIIKPESLWHWAVPQGNYSRIVAIALLVGWALHGFGNWNLGRARGIVFCLVAWYVCAAISGAFAPDQGLVMVFLETKAKIVIPVIVGITLIDSIERLKALIWTIVLSMGYVAYDLNMSYFDGFNRLEFAGFGGMDNNSMTIAIVAAVGPAFFLGLSQTVPWRKLLCFACAALLTHAVFFSFSRGGMVSLLAVGIVSFLLIPKQPKHYALFALGALLALRMAGPQVMERFRTTFAEAEERDASAQNRVEMWKVCAELASEQPIFGIGPDHFPRVAAQHGLPSGVEAHSLWLQSAAEIGIPGAVFLLAYYLLTCKHLWTLSRRRGPAGDVYDEYRSLSCIVISSMAGFIPAAQFVSLEGLELPYYIALLGAGTLRLLPENGASDVWHPAHIPAYNWHAYPSNSAFARPSSTASALSCD